MTLVNKGVLTMERKDELYHYGVPGMKWGKRKVAYDSSDSVMNRIKKTRFKTKC